MQMLSRRDREQLRHRAEILAGAEAIFAQKGFHNATMEDIAQKAEFAIGSLYKHFKSKESIFQAVFEERLRRFLEGLEAIIARPEPFDRKLDEVLQFWADFGEQNVAVLRIFHTFQETSDWHKEDLRKCIQPQMERYFLSLKQMVIQGIEEGCLRDLSAADLAAFFIGTFQAYFISVMKGANPGELKSKLDTVRSLLMFGAARCSMCPREHSRPAVESLTPQS